MANKKFSGWLVVDPNNYSGDLAQLLSDTGDSIQGDTTPSFDSIAARDSELAALSASQRRGALMHVAGRGWFGHDGAGLQDIATGLYKKGRTDAVVEGNGNARVESGFCFFDGQPPANMQLTSLMGGRYQFSYSLADGSGCLVQCFDSVTNAPVPSGNSVAFYWVAYK